MESSRKHRGPKKGRFTALQHGNLRLTILLKTLLAILCSSVVLTAAWAKDPTPPRDTLHQS